MKQENYIASLTPLRGLAALWVVVFHFDQLTMFMGMENLIHPDDSRFFLKGYLFVDFFFILSGFILMHVYGHEFRSGMSGVRIKSFLWARFTRLYPLHIACLLLHVVFFAGVLMMFPAVAEKFSFLYPWEALPVHIFLGQAWGSEYWITWNVPAWSISAEWAVYMLAPAVFFLIAKKFRYRWFIVALVAIGGLCAILMLNKKGDLNVTYDMGILRCISEFLLGIITYQLYSIGIGKKWFGSDVFFVLIMTLMLLNLHLNINDIWIIPCFIFLILAAAHNRGGARSILKKEVFNFLGEISYSVYLMQGIWLSLYWMGMDSWIQSHSTELVGKDTLFFILTWLLIANVASAVLTYRYIEIPARNWLRNIRLKVQLTYTE